MTSDVIPAAIVGADVAARAAAGPDEVALAVDGGDDLTYQAWEGRSNAIARGLGDRRVGAGTPVALLFDRRRWADFSTAHLGVLKAGAVAVLVSPGAAPADLARALAHSGAPGVLCPPDLAPPTMSMWAAEPHDLARGQAAAPVVRPVEPGDVAELIYPPAPLARPRAWARSHADLGAEAHLSVEGELVHAWAPGSLGGHHAMRLAGSGKAARVTTLAAFDPDRMCAVVARRRAGACGLTPALAAALVVSGAHRRHDVSSVGQVLLSGAPTAELRAALVAAFPGAVVVEMAGAAAPPIPPSGDVAPVAVSQEGMLWHEQFSPGSFNLPCLVRRYQGPLHAAALEWALSELVRRHQPLRSTFAVTNGEPRQVVGTHHRLTLTTVDLSGLPRRELDERAARLVAEATSRPFDLATGPLFEPHLLRLGHDDHVLVVRLHHTVFDDWSVDVFRRELSALYGAAVAGAPSPLMEPATTFADVCRRRRADGVGESGAASQAWWRQELRGAPLAVQLSIGDDGSGREAAPTGEALKFDLPPPLAAGIRALAPTLRATPYMTVLAAFSAVVARATGQDDLVIATVVAHRDGSDVEPLIGCFTKKVPLRLRLHGDPTFAELVGRTRASLLGALSHQDVAFDAAVQDALGRPAAEHGVVPHLTVVFQAETPQRVRLAMPGLAVGPFETGPEARRERHFSSPPTKADAEADASVWGDGMYLGTFLILSLLETADGMALVARGTFHHPKARRLLEDLESVLAAVAAEPSRRVSELPAGSLHAGGRPPCDPDGVVELRGFRARRSTLEAALSSCPGVAEVAVAVRQVAEEPRLVAYVVAGGEAAPTLGQLRRALWAEVPGALWPAEVVVVDALARLPDGRLDLAALPPPPVGCPPEPQPGAASLAAMWGEVRGRPAEPDLSYWQDFSFLQALAEVRDAGWAIPDEVVVRCRTPDTLAAALAATPAGRPRTVAP